MTTLQLQTPAATRKFWSCGRVLFCPRAGRRSCAHFASAGNYWVRVIDLAPLCHHAALGPGCRVVGYTGLLIEVLSPLRGRRPFQAALLVSPHPEVFPILNVWFPDGLHTSYLLIIPLAALGRCGLRHFTKSAAAHIPGIFSTGR